MGLEKEAATRSDSESGQMTRCERMRSQAGEVMATAMVTMRQQRRRRGTVEASGPGVGDARVYVDNGGGGGDDGGDGGDDD